MLTTDEGRDILHRSRTVEGIHGDEVFKDRGLEFTQIFPHAVRLKLEGTDSTALLIEFVGLGIIYGDMVKIDVNATGTLDIGTGLLQLREGLQSEEVHLNESSRFNHMTVILSAVRLHAFKVRIVCR